MRAHYDDKELGRGMRILGANEAVVVPPYFNSMFCTFCGESCVSAMVF